MYSADDEVIYPFALQGGSSQPLSFPYDVVIQEAYPGIQFQPLEPSGVYSAIREVEGCLWFVNNADFNTSTLVWTQENLCNAALPAYALELCADGTFNRYSAVATIIPGNSIAWQKLFEIDAVGSVISTPLVVTAGGDAADQVHVTWAAGTSTQQKALTIEVQDNASSADSLFEQFTLNGVTKWLVDKNGVLQAGSIPFARITGYTPPSFNNVTLTGTTTLAGPTISNGITNHGDITTDTLHVNTSATIAGAPIGDVPSYSTATFVLPTTGASVAISCSSSHGYPAGVAVVVYGSNGTSDQAFTGYVVGNNGSPSTSITVKCSRILIGTAGQTVMAGAVVSFGDANVFTSSDGSLTFNNTGSAFGPVTDIVSVNQFPPITTVSYTVPAVGGSVIVTCHQTNVFTTNNYVLLGNSGGTQEWQGIVTHAGGGVNPSTYTITCLKILIGSSGSTIAAGDGFITFGSYLPDAIPVGGTKIAQHRPTQAEGTAGYTLSLGTLPLGQGGAATTWQLTAYAGADIANGATQTLTGGGASGWESPFTQGEASNQANLMNLIGTANGGDSPTCTFLVVGGYGAGGPTPGLLNAFTLTATRTS